MPELTDMKPGTSSPEVTPQLTKTDAKDLKALVRRDSTLLLEEVDYRYDEYTATLRERRDEEKAAIQQERKKRDAQSRKEAETALAGIQRRVKNLNEAIVTLLTELSNDGWTSDNGYRNNRQPINPHNYAVEIDGIGHFRPPSRDDSDLDEQVEVIEDTYRAMKTALNESHRNAKRQVESQEAGMLRELTLQSITTEAARAFILDMPTADALLPAPETLQAIEA